MITAVLLLVLVSCAVSKPVVPISTLLGLNVTDFPFLWKSLRVGTWNVMEQPWFPDWYANAEKRLLTNDLDVLALQEVWTPEARQRILSIPGLNRKFPYSSFVPPDNAQFIGCDMTKDDVVQLAYAFIDAVIAGNTDTRQIQQPLVPMSALAYQYAVALAVMVPGVTPTEGIQCLACLINSLEYLDQGDVLGAIQQCGKGEGPKNGHKGENGQLILSRYPIENVKVTKFDSFLVNRANIHATIRGFKLSFGHFAYNLLEDAAPELGPFMTGALQTQMAEDFIAQKSDAVLGDLNSGHNYQAAGFNTLTAAGYISGFKNGEPDTWCTPSHANFWPCIIAGAGAPGTADAIDHILVKKGGRVSIHNARLFNDLPADMSDHLGVKAELRRCWWSKELEAKREFLEAWKAKQQ